MSRLDPIFHGLVHIVLDDGSNITATDGHSFHTTEGWRDAILLKKGDKLHLSNTIGIQTRKATASIIQSIRTESKVVQVFNLEVANAHTFFVGINGELVHNGTRDRPGHHIFPRQYRDWFRDRGIDIDKYIKDIDIDDHKRVHDNKTAKDPGGDWNRDWRKYQEKNPNATPKQIRDKGKRMCKKYGI